MPTDSGIRSSISLKHKWDGTTAPIGTDDETKGYSPGSVWIYEAAKRIYFCSYASVGEAIWKEPGVGSIATYRHDIIDSTQTIFGVNDFAPFGFKYKIAANVLSLYIDGVRQAPDAFSEIDNTTIQISDPLQVGSSIQIWVMETADLISGATVEEYVSSAPDGVKTVYTAADFDPSTFSYVPGVNSMFVFVEGILQEKLQYEETNSSTITFNLAPPDGGTVVIKDLGTILLADAIPLADKGAADGVPVLDANSEVIQLPSGAAAATAGYVLRQDGAWVAVGVGDMLASTYDPTAIGASAFARANHTGTQPLSTISDSGTAAAENINVPNGIATLDANTETNQLPAGAAAAAVSAVLQQDGAWVPNASGNTASLVADGWWKDASTGMIVQWGVDYVTGGGIGSSRALVITLPIAMPTAVIHVTGSQYTQQAGGGGGWPDNGGCGAKLNGASTTSITIFTGYYSMNVSWIAIGY